MIKLTTQVYKVTDRHDRSAIFSWWKEGLGNNDPGSVERIQYSADAWATALPYTGLFCFSSLAFAERFCDYYALEGAKIWRAVARYPRQHKYVRRSTVSGPDNTFNRADVIAEWRLAHRRKRPPISSPYWPPGTMIFQQIRLVELCRTYSLTPAGCQRFIYNAYD